MRAFRAPRRHAPLEPMPDRSSCLADRLWIFYTLTDVDLPQEMLRAIARRAQAERERHAKIIHAEGEFPAAERLTLAAEVMSRRPATLQLRYLQMLTEISTDKDTNIVFPSR